MRVKVGGAWKNVGNAYVKVGGAWKSVYPGSANFSNAATGTYSSGGVNYKYIRFTSSSTLTVTTAGYADVFLTGGGAGGGDANRGGYGGSSTRGNVYLPAGSLSVFIGAGGGCCGAGGASSRLGFFRGGGGRGAPSGNTAGIGDDGATGSQSGVVTNLSGSNVTYGAGGCSSCNTAGAANTGNGGGGTGGGGATGGGSGIVIVRVIV